MHSSADIFVRIQQHKYHTYHIFEHHLLSIIDSIWTSYWNNLHFAEVLSLPGGLLVLGWFPKLCIGQVRFVFLILSSREHAHRLQVQSGYKPRSRTLMQDLHQKLTVIEMLSARIERKSQRLGYCQLKRSLASKACFENKKTNVWHNRIE